MKTSFKASAEIGKDNQSLCKFDQMQNQKMQNHMPYHSITETFSLEKWNNSVKSEQWASSLGGPHYANEQALLLEYKRRRMEQSD